MNKPQSQEGRWPIIDIGRLGDRLTWSKILLTRLSYSMLVEPERRQWGWLNFVAFWIADSLNDHRLSTSAARLTIQAPRALGSFWARTSTCRLESYNTLCQHPLLYFSWPAYYLSAVSKLQTQSRFTLIGLYNTKLPSASNVVWYQSEARLSL
jgi:hypothetical protein